MATEEQSTSATPPSDKETITKAHLLELKEMLREQVGHGKTTIRKYERWLSLRTGKVSLRESRQALYKRIADLERNNRTATKKMKMIDEYIKNWIPGAGGAFRVELEDNLIVKKMVEVDAE
jgi:hypothetical protein